MPREKQVPEQISQEVKYVRRIKKLADLVVDDSHKATTKDRAFHRLIIQACLAYEYGQAYLTSSFAEVYDNTTKEKS